LAPEILTTLAQRSVSSTMNLPNSAGVIGIGSPPSSASLSFTFGSACAARISLLSVAMISGGVPLGALIAYHWLAS
jgi:hypothetical protein